MRVLVTGGAGYIGSHICRVLKESGDEPIAFDNLSQGPIPAQSGCTFVKGDIRDLATVIDVLQTERVEGIIHLAALSVASRAEEDPGAYTSTNVTGMMVLLQAASQLGIKLIVFSSTAAVYAPSSVAALDESSPTLPVGFYGRTKLFGEWLLEAHARDSDLRYVIFRYFNAAGAHPDGTIGEVHSPETHLIPRVLRAVQAGETVEVFGTDYPTPDGTCIRDYVHVLDLAEAHVQALRYLQRGGGSLVANLGTGVGLSVLEIITAIERVTGRPVRTRRVPRRPSDPPRLVATFSRAQDVFGWKPGLSDIETILATAWAWHRLHPEGYELFGDGDES